MTLVIDNDSGEDCSAKVMAIDGWGAELFVGDGPRGVGAVLLLLVTLCDHGESVVYCSQ